MSMSNAEKVVKNIRRQPPIENRQSSHSRWNSPGMQRV